MRRVLMTQDDKKVVIDTKSDDCLYSSPVNPPNTGTTYTRGSNLYAHKARSGNIYFYFHHWSMWQGSEDSYCLCTKQEAEEFLLEKLGNSGWDSLEESEAEQAEKDYGFELLTETA